MYTCLFSENRLSSDIWDMFDQVFALVMANAYLDFSCWMQRYNSSNKNDGRQKKKTCKLELFVPVYLSSAANRHCFFAPRQHSPSFSSYRCLLFLCPAQPVCPHILWHRHTLSHDCMSFGEMEGGGDYWNDEKFGITGFLACFNSNVCICLQMHKVLLKTI